MKNNNTMDTLYMVELALMTAIIFIMAFTPLGYFRTPGLSITFLTVPVAVGAIILGPKGGAVCGLVFGITSFIQCFASGGFGAMLLSINPVGAAFTCIVPRVLEGWLCGLIFTTAVIFAAAFVGAQGLIEAVVCFLIASAVSRTLAAALGQSRYAA